MSECLRLGVPIAGHKTEGPTPRLMNGVIAKS